MAYCAECGENNWDSATFCSACGASLDPTVTSRETNVSERENLSQQIYNAPERPQPPRGYGGDVYGRGPYHNDRYGAARPYPMQKINSHLVKAILVTIFCCQPFGIVSIVFAAQVDGRVRSGDIQGAIESSEKANKWANWSIIIGILPGIFYIIMVMIQILAMSASA